MRCRGVWHTPFATKCSYFAISIIWVIAQIVLIACFWGYPHIYDAGNYVSMAQRCFNNGQWYPMTEDVYSLWLCAQGLINFLILQLRIFGTVNSNAVFNLFFNITILLEVLCCLGHPLHISSFYHRSGN
jgi:hypothetical protein